MRVARVTATTSVATLALAGVAWLVAIRQMNGMDMGEGVRSGIGFGLYCVGSSIVLMAMLLALGIMSVTWMSVVAVPVVAQKVLPAKAVIDLPLALAITALGLLIVIAPASVPGLLPAM
jgi:predicted metal-binding membrane protein